MRARRHAVRGTDVAGDAFVLDNGEGHYPYYACLNHLEAAKKEQDASWFLVGLARKLKPRPALSTKAETRRAKNALHAAFMKLIKSHLKENGPPSAGALTEGMWTIDHSPW